MSKRKDIPIKQIEPELLSMRKPGYAQQQIADYFGLEKSWIKGWIKGWITRYNREQARLFAGLLPKHRGRLRRDAVPRDNSTYYKEI